MPLELQGPRDLSPLEEDAVNLVFNIGTEPIPPSELQLEIVESIQLGWQGLWNTNPSMVNQPSIGHQMSKRTVT